MINYSLDGTTSTPYPLAGLPGYGSGNVGFFAAPNGTVLAMGANGLPNFTGAWNPAGPVVPIATGPGKTAIAGIETPPSTGLAPTNPNIAASPNAEFEVVGWTGTATSWADAVAQGNGLFGFSGETFNGVSLGGLGWSQTTKNPNTIISILTPFVVEGAGGYQGLVLQTAAPEPSIFALGGLGAAILRFFGLLNHRKRRGAQD